MTILNASQTMGQPTSGNHRSDEALSDAWYPRSLMLRLMRNASRRMAHGMGRRGDPRLEPQSMSENLRRDIGVIDWAAATATPGASGNRHLLTFHITLWIAAGDPGGVRITTSIFKQRDTIMHSPNLIILYVRDPADSANFYKALLNREPVAAAPNFVAFALDGGFTLGLWRLSSVVPQPSAIGSRAEIAFMVPGENGVSNLYRDWRDRHLPIAQDLTQLDFGPTFVVLDPDGHRLRVCEPDK